MKKKNGGFIATSLIYSFFLVFVALVAALLTNFIATKTIMDRYNQEAARDLNTKKYEVSIYSRNSDIVNGMALTNRVSNSSFTSSDYWKTVGTTSTTFSSNSLYKVDSSSAESYLYQEIHFKTKPSYNYKYYYSISHRSASNSNFLTFIGSPSKGSLNTRNSNRDEWTKTSGIYESTTDSEEKFIVGRSSSAGSAFFKEAMVINLTDSFGEGKEPGNEWIDENIGYFEGTVSFIKQNQISSGEKIKIQFLPYQGHENVSINCVNPSNGRSIPGVSTSNITIAKNDEGVPIMASDGLRTYREFTINSVTSNIRCNIDWSES